MNDILQNCLSPDPNPLSRFVGIAMSKKHVWHQQQNIRNACHHDNKYHSVRMRPKLFTCMNVFMRKLAPCNQVRITYKRIFPTYIYLCISRYHAHKPAYSVFALNHHITSPTRRLHTGTIRQTLSVHPKHTVKWWALFHNVTSPGISHRMKCISHHFSTVAKAAESSFNSVLHHHCCIVA